MAKAFRLWVSGLESPLLLILQPIQRTQTAKIQFYTVLPVNKQCSSPKSAALLGFSFAADSRVIPAAPSCERQYLAQPGKSS